MKQALAKLDPTFRQDNAMAKQILDWCMPGHAGIPPSNVVILIASDPDKSTPNSGNSLIPDDFYVAHSRAKHLLNFNTLAKRKPWE